MRMAEEMCTVNREGLRTLLRERDLKSWWVAERVGIHKTTLRRWLSGKIQRAHEEKVAQLAIVLGTDYSNLTVSEK